MTQAEQPPQTKMQKLKASWEYRGARFIFRTIGYLMLLLYLLIGVNQTVAWIQIKLARIPPVEHVANVAARAIALNKPMDLQKWISMRPDADQDRIMQVLEPMTGEIGSFAFMQYAKWLHLQNRTDESFFWEQYARYRLRYDALRCGAGDSVRDMNGIIAIIAPNLRGRAALPEGTVGESLRAVLSLDAKHPARNDPAFVCDTLKNVIGTEVTPAPESEWAAIRHTLRLVTEDAIKRMEIPAAESGTGQ